MSQLSTFYSPLTATSLGLGNSANVTFGSVTTGAVTASGTLSGAGFTNRFAAPGPIGSTTPSTGAFTTLNATNGTITASAPVLDLAQTWNNAAVTFTGLRFNVTNTASASQSALLDLQVGGSSQFAVLRNNTTRFFGAHLTWFTTIGFETSAAINGATPVRFCAQSTSGEAGIRASGNIVEVMGTTTTSPQTFRLYNTFTDASNHERGFIGWSSNTLRIGTEAGGTGSARALELQQGGTTRLSLPTTGGVSVAGNLSVTGAGNLQVPSAQLIFWQNRGVLGSTADGTIFLQNQAGTDFNRLMFGGGTSSFPALKRSSTTLQVRLADDSADAPLSCGVLNANGSGASDLVAEFGTAAGGRNHAIQIWGNGSGRNHIITASTTAGLQFTLAGGAATAGIVTSTTNGGFRAYASGVYAWTNGANVFSGTVDLLLRRDAAGILAQYDGVNAQAYRLYNTFTSSTSFERLNIRWASNECIIDAEAGSGGGTLRGIKIGSATSSLLGFYGATPVDRPATVADPAGGGTVDTEARTAINDLIDRLQELGLIA